MDDPVSTPSASIETCDVVGRNNKSAVTDAGVEERLTETEWLSKYRQSLGRAVLVVSDVIRIYEEIMHTHTSDAHTQAFPIIDFGANSTADGSIRTEKLSMCTMIRGRQNEQRKFRFGDNKEYVIDYSVEVGFPTGFHRLGKKANITFRLRTIIIHGMNVPLLASRRSLRKIHGFINFSTNR